MFDNMLVVCVGNICRSPMAEYVFKQMIRKSDMNISISSAGLDALVGYAADDNAISVTGEHGLDIKAHRARQLDEAMVKQNELILVMEHWQQKEIESLYPYARGRVHLLGKWNDMGNEMRDEVEISDPYKQSKEAFAEAFEKIEKACEVWCKKI